MRIKSKLVSTALAVPMAAALVVAGAPPASADVGVILSAASAAYQAYKFFTDSQVDLDTATTRIIDAVNSAKTETLGHLDQIAAADVQACARSAVIDFEDIRLFSPDTQQDFARDATSCVATADAYIGAVDDPGAVDHLGFALNIVGPIALIARSTVGWSTGGLTETLRGANNRVVSRLKPSCSTRTEPYFDDRGKPIPSLADNFLTCTAYNGDQGFDYVQGRMPPGGFDYRNARTQALVRTSQPVALAALARL